MKEVVIVGGVRTPIGSHGGAFRTLTAQHLATVVFKEVIDRVGIDPHHFDDVILGCIGQQSDAVNIGRVAGLLAGVPATACRAWWPSPLPFRRSRPGTARCSCAEARRA
jgi:acetyl-CoA acetyltransferase